MQRLGAHNTRAPVRYRVHCGQAAAGESREDETDIRSAAELHIPFAWRHVADTGSQRRAAVACGWHGAVPLEFAQEGTCSRLKGGTPFACGCTSVFGMFHTNQGIRGSCMQAVGTATRCRL